MFTLHASKVGVALMACLVLTGCPDKEKHASIEMANKGVEAYNNQSWDTAIQHFKDATRKYPANHQAWYSMGEVQAKQGHWKEASKAYQEAVKHKGDDAMYNMRLGESRYRAALDAATDDKGNVGKLGNLSEARSALERSVELNKDLFRAWYYLGLIYANDEEPKKAAEAWTTACALNPNFGKPFSRLGELYLSWEKLDEAVRVLSQGGQHVIDQHERTNVFYNLGFAYDMKSRLNPAEEKSYLDKAIEAYSKALDARTDNVEARLQRGLDYVRKGDKAKAEADLSDYLKRGAGSPFDRQEATKALYGIGGNPL